MFIGACLLLADISMALALTPALEKEKPTFQTAASTENLPGESAEPKGECFFVSIVLKIYGTRLGRDTN